MSRIAVVIYREADGSAPFLDWFKKLSEKAQGRCRVRLTAHPIRHTVVED